MKIPTHLIQGTKGSLEEGPLRHDADNEDFNIDRKGRSKCGFGIMIVIMSVLFMIVTLCIGRMVYIQLNDESDVWKYDSKSIALDYIDDEDVGSLRNREHELFPLLPLSERDKENVMETFNKNSIGPNVGLKSDKRNLIVAKVLKKAPRDLDDELRYSGAESSGDGISSNGEITQIQNNPKIVNLRKIPDLKEKRICAKKIDLPLDMLSEMIHSDDHTGPYLWRESFMNVIMEVVAFGPDNYNYGWMMDSDSDYIDPNHSIILSDEAYHQAICIQEGISPACPLDNANDGYREAIEIFHKVYLVVSPRFQSCMKELKEIQKKEAS